jgi:hypothetical protein
MRQFRRRLVGHVGPAAWLGRHLGSWLLNNFSLPPAEGHGHPLLLFDCQEISR